VGFTHGYSHFTHSGNSGFSNPLSLILFFCNFLQITTIYSSSAMDRRKPNYDFKVIHMINMIDWRRLIPTVGDYSAVAFLMGKWED
jgi:hypothetical protein